MMNRLVRKCSSLAAGDLWVPDMSNSMMENQAITNETAIAKMSLHRVRSPLSGSFSIDYLCKYIATCPNTTSTTSPDPAGPLDCTFSSEELEELSNSSLSTVYGGLSPGMSMLSELEEQDVGSGYISFPPVDEIINSDIPCNEGSPSSTRTLFGTISNSIRKRAASV
ncbi:hypothetical protein K493DRAFT_318736 [Basidiobolus meristosporus CBS 931.73]|uniref:Uncharacterized protein n=1 Tax=Basidiobolus meristosporus CBS 931.73 TaxID=1314790 RepID=A0A1Y1XUI0_9FUNG|nr:hypothetical protein K493DRAFT_318736 [Basidiobolus meristosporus CBS 931.73]|eukprot:ORX89373.1 hypothetical protein K493DRAFT_318736 [Basidiobolus meristosporus CBS 931.73]